jgi:putative endopeptidase
MPLHFRLRPFHLAFLALSTTLAAQIVPRTPPQTNYLPAPSFDTASMDPKADPCVDFYKFACGNYAAHNPIPADQPGVDQFQTIENVNTQELNGILLKYAAPNPNRTPNQQKIGDYYAACLNTDLVEQKGLAPIQPLLDQIDKVSKFGLPYLTGELQRYGVTAFFSFSEGQDFKDSSKQVAYISQGGLGLPERDYYTRTGDKDKLLRDQYLAHITRMLTLSGTPAAQAATDARNILAFETKLAEASLTVTAMRDLEATYHPQTLAGFEASIRPVPFAPFLTAIHAPSALPGPLGPDSLVNSTPQFFPAMVSAVMAADTQTLRAYLRFHTLDAFFRHLPKRFFDEGFDFYSRKLNGIPEEEPQWKLCSYNVDNSLGEALGQVWAEQFFPASSKAKTLQMVQDIEAAMDRDIDTLAWMSAPTKLEAKEKLHAVINKIGYPDHWRDYASLIVSPTDAIGNDQRSAAFENDRQLNKIGQPVDRLEWEMTPPTVNAYESLTTNTINFPGGILQPALFDPSADLALNYGHIGAIIGHELTHGFDDEGHKFDAQGNLRNWWTADDLKLFDAKTSCIADEYSNFVAVPDPKDPVKINGHLTLGENIADNGGLVLAYSAYLDRAKRSGIDIDAKTDGFTGPQHFYIAYAQNYCENARPEIVRNQVLTDPHSPGHFRANGAIVNQPNFAPTFGCKLGTPMAPVKSCRIW